MENMKKTVLYTSAILFLVNQQKVRSRKVPIHIIQMTYFEVPDEV
jgi:hypothetical protein